MNPFTVDGAMMIKGSFRELVKDYEVLRIVIYNESNSENVVSTSKKEEINTILDSFLALKVKADNWSNDNKPALDYRITFSARYPNSTYLKQYELKFNDQFFQRQDKDIYYKVKNENELYNLLKKEY